MRIFLIVSIVFLSVLNCFGQEEERLGVFESDSTWLKEIIHFPINFAPEIKYEGYEDLRFAKSWRDKDHLDFWSYSYVWHVKGLQKPSTKELIGHIESYYDGLMTAVNKKKDYTIPETTVMLSKDGSKIKKDDFIGEITFYDSFTTETVITLKVRIKIEHCQTKNETMLIFRLSPQDFDQAIWQRFNDIKIREEICY